MTNDNSHKGNKEKTPHPRQYPKMPTDKQGRPGPPPYPWPPEFKPPPGYPPPGYPPPSYPPPYPPPGYPPPPMPYYRPLLVRKLSELSIVLIFLVCITVYWLPLIISILVAIPIYWLDPQLIEVLTGIVLCIITIALMYFLREYLDKPTLKDYGLTTKNLANNLSLIGKLIFIIVAVEFIVYYLFQKLGVSFKSEPLDINILVIISIVIIAPVFEETVYRMNASTLLARRLPIIWVAVITSIWFIAKHIPMWHIDNEFGLPALAVIVPMGIIVWIVVTYYYLKRNCIWIPLFVHMFNNGMIALFIFIPDPLGDYLEYITVVIGIVFIFVFAAPKIYRIIIKNFQAGKFDIKPKTYQNLGITAALTILFLITSEALIGFQYISPEFCLVLGFILTAISVVTVILVLANQETVYVKN